MMCGFCTSHAFAATLQILSYHVQPIPKTEGENGIEVTGKAKLAGIQSIPTDESVLFSACLNLPLRADFGFDSVRCFSTFKKPPGNGKIVLHWDFPFRYLKLAPGPQNIVVPLDPVTVRMIAKGNLQDEGDKKVDVSGSPLNLQFTMPVVKSLRLQFGEFNVTQQANWDVAVSNDGALPDIYILVEVGSKSIVSSKICIDSYQCNSPLDTGWFSVAEDDKVVVTINDQDKNESLGGLAVSLFTAGLFTPHTREIISSYSFSLNQWEALSGKLVEDPNANFQLLKAQIQD